MGRSNLGRDNPSRNTIRVKTESKETVSNFVSEPKPGDTIITWMASGHGEAGPFVFRIDRLVGLTADFEISILQPTERSQKLFSGVQGAGALNQSIKLAPGDRLVITLKGVRERSQGEQTSAEGVWVSFTYTRASETVKVDVE